MSKFPNFCLSAVLSAALASGATPTIGVATAVGTFKVNSADVEGNANVFDGAQIRTGKSPSQVFLQGGASVTLGKDSAGSIFRDHLVLQQGATRIQNMSGYTVEASRYRIQGDAPQSQAVVRFNEGDVEIAALAGSLRVSNEKGVLLTRIGAGTASAFSQSPANNGAPINTENRPKQVALYALLLASLGGLGLAVDAVFQPSPRNSVSP